MAADRHLYDGAVCGLDSAGTDCGREDSRRNRDKDRIGGFEKIIGAFS